MVVYEEISGSINKFNQNICLKNNIAQLHFMLARVELRRNFSSIPKDGSGNHRSSNRKWVSLMCITGNL